MLHNIILGAMHVGLKSVRCTAIVTHSWCILIQQHTLQTWVKSQYKVYQNMNNTRLHLCSFSHLYLEILLLVFPKDPNISQEKLKKVKLKEAQRCNLNSPAYSQRIHSPSQSLAYVYGYTIKSVRTQIPCTLSVKWMQGDAKVREWCVHREGANTLHEFFTKLPYDTKCS